MLMSLDVTCFSAAFAPRNVSTAQSAGAQLLSECLYTMFSNLRISQSGSGSDDSDDIHRGMGMTKDNFEHRRGDVYMLMED